MGSGCIRPALRTGTGRDRRTSPALGELPDEPYVDVAKRRQLRSQSKALVPGPSERPRKSWWFSHHGYVNGAVSQGTGSCAHAPPQRTKYGVPKGPPRVACATIVVIFPCCSGPSGMTQHCWSGRSWQLGEPRSNCPQTMPSPAGVLQRRVWSGVAVEDDGDRRLVRGPGEPVREHQRKESRGGARHDGGCYSSPRTAVNRRAQGMPFCRRRPTLRCSNAPASSSTRASPRRSRSVSRALAVRAGVGDTARCRVAVSRACTSRTGRRSPRGSSSASRCVRDRRVNRPRGNFGHRLR